MPLDFGQPHLADLASWLGITPVPQEVLDQHKRNEVAKRPGNWLYRHDIALVLMPFGFGFALILTGIGLIVSMLLLNVFVSAASVSFALATGFLACYINNLRVYGPAKWSEQVYRVSAPRYWPDNQVAFLEVIDAPASIKQLAYKVLQRGQGDMTLVYGTLTQDSWLVDPYLAIRRGNEQIVLGIWDDTGIIMEAETREV
jgi:hypothetical protein